jgi:large subunit ribosomal protein L12
LEALRKKVEKEGLGHSNRRSSEVREELKYVYAALLLHSAGQKIDEDSLKKIISATGGEVDEARVKALVASLSEVNIDEALKAGQAVVAAPAPAKEAVPAPEAKKEEKKKEEGKKEEEAIAGLGALFG